MECSDGKSAETGRGSSIQWPLPDTGGVCRCFVLVHAVTGDTRHTGDIETRRWCNQLSDSSPHHISFQPSSQLPRPNLNTNTGTHHKERVDKLTAEFISNIHGLAIMNTLAGFPYYLSITDDRQGFIFQI